MNKILILIIILGLNRDGFSQVNYSNKDSGIFKKNNSVFFFFERGLMPAQKIIPDNPINSISYFSRPSPGFSFGIAISSSLKKLKFETGIKEIDFTADTHFKLDSSILGFPDIEKDRSVVAAVFNFPLIISYKIINNTNSELTAGIQLSFDIVPAYSYGYGIAFLDSFSHSSALYGFSTYENRKSFFDGGIKIAYEHRIFHKLCFESNFNSLFLSNQELMKGSYSIFGINKTYSGTILKRFRYYAIGMGLGWKF